jgi:hypothetical protein
MARFTVAIPRWERMLFKVREGLRERQWYDWSLCSSCGWSSVQVIGRTKVEGVALTLLAGQLTVE